MQERQVTIGDTTFQLPHPFLVLATQNPIDQEGTYPLPEAQIDRFMLKLHVNYPTKQEEKEIMSRIGFSDPANIQAVISPSELDELERIVKSVYMDERLMDYIVDIVMATRKPEDYGIDIHEYIQFGASPRASIYLSLASRAQAFLNGRAFVTPHDIKTIAAGVLRHRIILSYEAEAEGISSDDIVSRILDGVEVP
jgi:MoxR-like ATPase